MSLYELREKFKGQKEVFDAISIEISKIEETLNEFEKDFTKSHSPEEIHRVKARIEVICTILGIEAKGNYRVNYKEQ